MNNQIKYLIRKTVLAYYGFRYSSYFSVAMPIVGIVAGILIIFLLILPQFLSWFSVRSEVEAAQKRIDIMRANAIVLQNVNKSSLDRDFVKVAEALPSNKDFVSILNTINKAASVSNIILEDYNFSLGTIPLSESKRSKADAYTVQISLTVEGSAQNTNSFLKEIERRLPISQIKTINYTDLRGNIVLLYNIKPFPKLDINYSDPLTGYTQKDETMLEILRQWSGE